MPGGRGSYCGSPVTYLGAQLAHFWSQLILVEAQLTQPWLKHHNFYPKVQEAIQPRGSRCEAHKEDQDRAKTTSHFPP